MADFSPLPCFLPHSFLCHAALLRRTRPLAVGRPPRAETSTRRPADGRVKTKTTDARLLSRELLAWAARRQQRQKQSGCQLRARTNGETAQPERHFDQGPPPTLLPDRQVFGLEIEKPVCAYRVKCHFSLMAQQLAAQWQAVGALPGTGPFGDAMSLASADEIWIVDARCSRRCGASAVRGNGCLMLDEKSRLRWPGGRLVVARVATRRPVCGVDFGLPDSRSGEPESGLLSSADKDQALCCGQAIDIEKQKQSSLPRKSCQLGAGSEVAAKQRECPSGSHWGASHGANVP
ncbi:hypothetical protein QBC34DRAFT_419815 [Podospora aff. communis PSN243]|uniref:Uncharacterized protein n=1 Tax=Podospora aff. communis PSN243 TaxID=3040156 RepID=A0AAV9H819_9PEZI|nr:hypothetical protein QBC34DRAFT_419815 [Podospora aff. communis PSN243]